MTFCFGVVLLRIINFSFETSTQVLVSLFGEYWRTITRRMSQL